MDIRLSIEHRYLTLVTYNSFILTAKKKKKKEEEDDMQSLK